MVLKFLFGIQIIKGKSDYKPFTVVDKQTCLFSLFSILLGVWCHTGVPDFHRIPFHSVHCFSVTFSLHSKPDSEKNGTFASPTTAFANKVFPVPGGPTRRAPLKNLNLGYTSCFFKTTYLSKYFSILLAKLMLKDE